MPSYIVSMLTSLNATRLYANIEYELDELRRDISICGIAKERGISVALTHDRCIVEPGVVQTKEGKVYTVSYLPPSLFSLFNTKPQFGHDVGVYTIPQNLAHARKWYPPTLLGRLPQTAC